MSLSTQSSKLEQTYIVSMSSSPLQFSGLCNGKRLGILSWVMLTFKGAPVSGTIGMSIIFLLWILPLSVRLVRLLVRHGETRYSVKGCSWFVCGGRIKLRRFELRGFAEPSAMCAVGSARKFVACRDALMPAESLFPLIDYIW